MTCERIENPDSGDSGRLSRRKFVQVAGASAAAFVLGPDPQASPTAASARVEAPVQNRAPLAAQPYYLLPTGTIRPAGWLKHQLEIQAGGLGGHLDDVWQDVGPTSGWLGGNGESWERGPYFLDGLLPLAWALDSEPLKAKAQRFIEWILANQQPNGMIGPLSNNDWWPRIVALKALTQYQELTGDPRVIPLMTRYFSYQLIELPKRPLSSWGRFRWQDELLSVLWLYNRTGDTKLLQLARLLKAQSADWGAFYANFPFHEKVDAAYLHALEANNDHDTIMYAHGVNNAMALKASALWSIVSLNETDRRAIHQHLAVLDQYHGLPIGLFSADEHFSGRNPSQGVELCTIVEAMYSLELALAITGDGALADRIERIAYNALPAALTDDMWAHQYDQQPNQIECSLKPGPWSTNGPTANLFGLAAFFGCCTANFHQGWPKLTSSLWMAASEGGLAAMIYAPCELYTQVRAVTVRITETTDYPFRDRVQLTIEPERPLAFPLKLRVPRWARGMNCKVNGKTPPGTLVNGFLLVERTWRKGDRVELVFNFESEKVSGFMQSVSIARGPLLFSLPIGERWRKIAEYGPTGNWEVFPTSAWNYAIVESAALRTAELPISAVPFSGKYPSVTVTVNARIVSAWKNDERAVPEWANEKNYAPPPPQSPVTLTNGATQALTLIPYGAAKLRITSFPTVET